MNLYIFVILYTVLYTISGKYNSDQFARSQLYDELDGEFRNYLCCKNNMKCCKRRGSSAPAVEIRAILARCPEQSTCGSSTKQRWLHKPIWMMREGELKQFQGFDEDEPTGQTSITNCRKKLALTMKISADPKFLHNNFEYIIVDHAYDPVSTKKRKLLIPYVVKFRQEPVTQMYGMRFIHVVNAHVREEILNKHMSNFTGCDTTSRKPTCGRIMFKGKVVPYSEGFCCSCDPVKNRKRQPETVTDYSENIISYSDPAFLLDGVECPKYATGTGGNEFQGPTIPGPEYQAIVPEVVEEPSPNDTALMRESRKKYGNLGSYKLNSDFGFRKGRQRKGKMKFRRAKRQVQAGGTQRRGGQNCADRYTPKGVDPETYHESAHCLRFSELWYTVYRLQAPLIEHSISFQVFEKREDREGRTVWKDLTGCRKVRVGSIIPSYINEKGTFAIKYTPDPVEADPSSFALDHKSALLLVPEGSEHCDPKKYPEIVAGPAEYLVVHSSQVSLYGDQCNIAGVGFEAFVKQPNRCTRPKGTCLLNQPYHLWKHDHLAASVGKKGCFFLRFYGKLPEDPIRKHKKTNEQYLAMEYPESYSTKIDFEIKADFNTVIRRRSPAVITEVYVDSTSPKKTILTIKITNNGLVASTFMAKLSDCPLEMPADFNNIESQQVLIPPQHQHIFHLNIKCILPVDRFHCSVEALNSKRELVALRRIRIQKFDRCICTWHCLCACLGSAEGLRCVPMSLQQYHAAGFQGGLPITTHIVHYTLVDEIISFMTYIALFLMLILFMLGLSKAIIGICCSPVIGILGLDVILDLPAPIKRYYEIELRDRRVVYDREGWPIHPDTKERVRSIARTTEFCMNIVFFFAFPMNVSLLLLKKLFCLPCTYENNWRCRCRPKPKPSETSCKLTFTKLFPLSGSSKQNKTTEYTSPSTSITSARSQKSMNEKVSQASTHHDRVAEALADVMEIDAPKNTVKSGFSSESATSSGDDDNS